MHPGSRLFQILTLLAVGICVGSLSLPAQTAARTVSSEAEFSRTVTGLGPGDQLIFAKGAYTQAVATIRGLHGTAAQPIVIRAAYPGAAVFSGKAALTIENSSYLVIEGLVLTSPNLTSIHLLGSNHIRITQCRISHQDSVECKWIVFEGKGNDDNRFDHNLVEGKHGPGQMMTVRGELTGADSGTIGKRTLIDHNIFRDNGPRVANGQETLQLGLSPYTQSSGFTVVEYNRFENCDADPEYLSVKSCDNIIRYNTFVDNAGTLTLRQGDRTEVYGNCFLGTGVRKDLGGVRIYGAGHRIYDNYFEGLNASSGKIAAICLDSGEAPTGSKTTGLHRAASSCEVFRNTIMRCSTGIALGPGYQVAPSACRIASNLILETAKPFLEALPCQDMRFEGNLAFPSADSRYAAVGRAGAGVGAPEASAKELRAGDLGIPLFTD